MVLHLRQHGHTNVAHRHNVRIRQAQIDIDHCRDPDSHSIEAWAQNFLGVACHTYAEVTPSGAGIRIWGLTAAGSDPVHRKYTIIIDGKEVAIELFRRTAKALTITGYKLNNVHELGNIDQAFGWATAWVDRRKAAVVKAPATQFNGCSFIRGEHDIDDIELLVREGAQNGANRSDEFHKVVGHYHGCGWSVEKIHDHLQQYPEGIGGRYLSEGRLLGEINRSLSKYEALILPLFNGLTAPQEVETRKPAIAPKTPTSVDEEDDESADPDDGTDDVGDADAPDELEPPPYPLYAHGDTTTQPLKGWLLKHLLPAVGHGLLSGQWGTGKTFIAFDLAAAIATMQPWLNRQVKRQCGVLLIAAEGGSEVRLRLDAVIRSKCGGIERAPFRWYENTPPLLQKDATKTLIGMAAHADQSLRNEFGLPLGLIIIDTIAACAGYSQAGGENDPATTQAVMNVLKHLSQELDCFVLGVDHFGKNMEAGTRGSSSKESASDVVLACLGDKELSGSVANTRLAIRKHRGGQQGQVYPFALRTVEAAVPDEDGEPITSMVVEWLPQYSPDTRSRPGFDPWAQSRRQDQRAAVKRLQRVLMGALAEHGAERQLPQGQTAWMIDQEVVRELFFAQTPADGTPKQKYNARRIQFMRALDWAEAQELVAIHEVDEVTYLRLCNHTAGNDDGEE